MCPQWPSGGICVGAVCFRGWGTEESSRAAFLYPLSLSDPLKLH